MQTTALTAQIVHYRSTEFARQAEDWRRAAPARKPRRRLAFSSSGQYFGHGRQGQRRQLHRAGA